MSYHYGMPKLMTLRGAAAAVAIGLPLGACGSSSSSSQSNAASSKASSTLAFAQCMRTHGVPTFPDPGSNGQGGLKIQASQRAGSGASLTVNGVSVNAPAFQSAMQSCRSKLPNGGHPPPLSASQREAMLKFSQCMRAHGLANFPDPTFGANGAVGLRLSPASGINPSSPAFKTAQAACSPLQKRGFSLVGGP